MVPGTSLILYHFMIMNHPFSESDCNNMIAVAIEHKLCVADHKIPSVMLNSLAFR